MTTTGSLQPTTTPRPRRWLTLLPLLAFLGLAALFAIRLGAGDPSVLPSALIGRKVPDFALPPLDKLPVPGLSTADLMAGHVTLVNVFASWCAECHDEHDALMALSTDPALQSQGVRMAGLVYKDDAENARRYLGLKGNPFTLVGNDRSGRTGLDFGVYGVPETFVVRGDGTVAYKLVGALTDANRPALLAAIRLAVMQPAAMRPATIQPADHHP